MPVPEKVIGTALPNVRLALFSVNACVNVRACVPCSVAVPATVKFPEATDAAEPSVIVPVLMLVLPVMALAAARTRVPPVPPRVNPPLPETTVLMLVNAVPALLLNRIPSLPRLTCPPTMVSAAAPEPPWNMISPLATVNVLGTAIVTTLPGVLLSNRRAPTDRFDAACNVMAELPNATTLTMSPGLALSVLLPAKLNGW